MGKRYYKPITPLDPDVVHKCDRCRENTCTCAKGAGVSSRSFASRAAAIKHLEAHVEAGHAVPEYAFARLREESAALKEESEK